MLFHTNLKAYLNKSRNNKYALSFLSSKFELALYTLKVYPFHDNTAPPNPINNLEIFPKIAYGVKKAGRRTYYTNETLLRCVCAIMKISVNYTR